MARKPVLTLVTGGDDGLRSKLDRVAHRLADALLDDDVPIPDQIAGLKALAAYRNGRSGAAEVVKNAFDGYRASLAAEDDEA